MQAARADVLAGRAVHAGGGWGGGCFPRAAAGAAADVPRRRALYRSYDCRRRERRAPSTSPRLPHVDRRRPTRIANYMRNALDSRERAGPSPTCRRTARASRARSLVPRVEEALRRAARQSAGEVAAPKRLSRLLTFYDQMHSLFPQFFQAGRPVAADDLVTRGVVTRTPTLSFHPATRCADDPSFRDAQGRDCLFHATSAEHECGAVDNTVRLHCAAACDANPAYTGDPMREAGCDTTTTPTYRWSPWASYVVAQEIQTTILNVKAAFKRDDAFARYVTGALFSAVDRHPRDPDHPRRVEARGRRPRVERRQRVPRPGVARCVEPRSGVVGLGRGGDLLPYPEALDAVPACRPLRRERRRGLLPVRRRGTGEWRGGARGPSSPTRPQPRQRHVPPGRVACRGVRRGRRAHTPGRASRGRRDPHAVGVRGGDGLPPRGRGARGGASRAAGSAVRIAPEHALVDGVEVGAVGARRADADNLRRCGGPHHRGARETPGSPDGRERAYYVDGCRLDLPTCRACSFSATARLRYRLGRPIAQSTRRPSRCRDRPRTAGCAQRWQLMHEWMGGSK